MRFNRPLLALVGTVVAFASDDLGHALAQDVQPTAPEASQPPQPSPNEAAPLATPRNSNQQAQIDREIADLLSKAEQSSATPAVWAKLGNALMQKSREIPDSGLYERAKSAYHKALDLDPQNEDALVGLAWVHNTQHEFDEGRTWAEKALAVNSGLAHAHALLGDAAVELGDYDAALDHFQKALDTQPDLSSYSRAAHLIWLMGDARKGRWLMEKAIKAGGPYAENTAWCRAELALMLWHDGALLPAEQQAETALKGAPKNAHVLATMGRIKMAKKEYDKAIDLYRRAIEITPSHDSLVALGDLYILTGQTNEAEKQYKRVVELHASGAAHSHGGLTHTHPDGQGNAQLARFYADHDRNLDEALRGVELAYRTYTNVFVADTLAWCYYKKGEYERAKSTIRKALQHKTPDASLLFHAGMIYAKTGDKGSAQKYLYQALSLNPHFDPQQAVVAADTLKLLAERPAGKSAEDAKPGK